MSKFCELLNDVIVKKKLTKVQIAESFGWTPMYFGRYCTGKLLPTQSNIQKFASLLELSCEELQKIIDEDLKERVYGKLGNI